MSKKTTAVKRKVAEEVLRADALEIKEADLEGELRNQAGSYAYWSTQCDEAQHVCELARLDLEVLKAELLEKRRKRKERDGGRIVETRLQSEITLEPKYKKAQKTYLEAKLEHAKLKTLTLALAQRKDMLMAIAANWRREVEMSR